MTKVKDDEENAYGSLDDWQIEDANALKSSIRQHAELIGGGDDTLQDDEDLAPVPVIAGGSSRQLDDTWQDEPAPFSNHDLQSSLRSSRRQIRSTDSVASQSRVSFSPDTPMSRANLTANAKAKSGTKLRALIALLCLVASLLLAIFVGGGKSGQSIAKHTIGLTPGTTLVKGAPTSAGIPVSSGNYPTYNGTFPLPDLESMNIILSAEMENMADWRIPFPAGKRTDLPVFWQIPKAGGQVVERILGLCLGLVEVTGDGVGNDDKSLRIMQTNTGIRFLNIDSTTVEGIQRAKELDLVKSGMAEVFFTNLIPETATIFNPSNRGRIFTILRHPLQRAMSQYNSAKISNPVVADMSLSDYAANYLPNNEMVRGLTGKGTDALLTDVDLYVAMEIIRRKVVVGLVGRIEESMARFHGYFGWSSLLVDGVATCQTDLLALSSEALPSPAEGTAAYNFMLAQNRLDLRLYEYAEYMYDVQGGKKN